MLNHRTHLISTRCKPAKKMRSLVTSLIIADNHFLIREALKRALTKYQIVGEAEDSDSALELVRQKKPDIILLDISMPKRSGMSIIKEIKACHKDIKILVITLKHSKKSVDVALKAGADGYFLKDENVAKLRTAVARVLEGGTYISPGLIDPEE
jgi:DNA-binding NarL/FixJ family response regulator